MWYNRILNNIKPYPTVNLAGSASDVIFMTIKMSKNGKEQFSGIQTRGNCGHLSLVQLACLSGWGEVGLTGSTESTANASPTRRASGHRKNVSFGAFRFHRTHV